MTFPPEDPTFLPFQDTNHNGRLDGDELSKQLHEEIEANAIHSGEPIIASILQTANIDELATYFNKAPAADKQELSPSYATAIEARLHALIERMNANLKQCPDARETAIANVMLAHFSKQETDRRINQIDRVYDFAESYKKIFPNGIAITAADVPAIMAELGKLTPPDTMPKRSNAVINTI